MLLCVLTRSSVSLSLRDSSGNDASLSSGQVSGLVEKMLATPSAGSPSHYARVVALHLSASQIVKEAMHALAALLSSQACGLRMLDVSMREPSGLFLELAGCSLHAHIGSDFTEAQWREVISQIVAGVAFLHSVHVIHRDLKVRGARRARA